MKKIFASVCLFVVAVASSYASTLVYDFERVVTSSGTPGGTGPFATATFEDIGVDLVKFTFTHNAGSAAGQKITKAYFTVDPTIASISTSNVSDTSGRYSGFSYGQNSHNAPLGASFDVLVEFSPQNPGFDPGDTVMMHLSGVGLTASSFDFLTTANEIGATPAMIHMQGIAGGGSAHLDPVPEPATMALAAPVALAWWRKRKKSA